MNLVKSVFSADKRSLALFRILLGFLLILDTLQKALLIPDFYADSGVLPRAYWIENYMSNWKWSLHLASGSLGFQVCLFALQFYFLIQYTLGYKTRQSGFLALILIMSMHARNNLILAGVDELMKLGLLFSLFLPIDHFFALTIPKLNKIEKNDSLATMALFFQLIFMYLFTAFLKWHPIWHTEGSAIYYAVNIDMYIKPLGAALRNYPLFMKLATFATLAYEFIGPLLALIPGRTRLYTAFSFIIFHLILFSILEIGLFPWACMVYWVAFFPANFWQTQIGIHLEKRLTLFFSDLHSWLNSRLHLNLNLSSRQTPLAKAPIHSMVPAFLILIIGIYNVDTLNLRKPILPPFAKQMVHKLNLNQVWNMFAPYPIKNDGWFSIAGTFKDGSKVDLMTQKEPSYSKPKNPSAAYPNSEWRKYMVNVWDEGKERILLPFGNYLCKKHTVEGKVLASIKIDFIKETTPAPNENWTLPEPINLWNHDCFIK